jgi:hypothetical protein
LAHLDRFRTLIQPGIIGNYTHSELTEIFVSIDRAPPQNVYTLAVLEERDASAPSRMLNPKHLTVPRLKGWSFGIERTVLPVADFENALAAFAATKLWAPTKDPTGTGALQEADPQFVPPDQAMPIPLNKALKNNYWGGSHILEWADPEKALFKPLFDKSDYLKALGERLLPFVPIDLALMSDRLGNIVIQVPVATIMSTCEPLPDNAGYRVRAIWRPGASPRPLRATIMAEYDETVTGFASAAVTDVPITLPVPGNALTPKVFLLDETNGLLIGATGALGWITQVGMKIMGVGRAEPRTFGYVDQRGHAQFERVALRGPVTESLVGQPRTDPNGGFTGKRIYRFDTERVQRERLFRQYGLPGRRPQKEREQALSDIRYLIGQHGEDGTWLWDPYLDAVDLLETLFHSPFSGPELRALGSTEGRKRLPIVAFMAKQARILDATTGNLLGLRLAFRIPHGRGLAKFHDRFLIFPKKDGGHLAWSLGTSVNSLGKAHHILQRVDDGQRVSDAFQDFWRRTTNAHLVWQKP